VLVGGCYSSTRREGFAVRDYKIYIAHLQSSEQASVRPNNIAFPLPCELAACLYLPHLFIPTTPGPPQLNFASGGWMPL
jgi:hypothetical protein